MSDLRWKVVTILAVFVVFFGLGVYPILASRYHLIIMNRAAGGTSCDGTLA